MFASHAEMSYGDQAALLGVLSQVRPKVSLEIGTYEGGSLALIAPMSEHVHTFDLVSHVDEHRPNVTYHLGDSRETLPALLASLAASGTNVDFVLIDGDHERSAVAADLRAVLESPAVSRAVILMHDAANEGVRAGIRDADLDRPHVAFADLSFTVPSEPLRPWSEGWGGFAMIVVDRTGDFWPLASGVAANAKRRTSVPQRLGWHALSPARAVRRRLGYRLRPWVRRFRGIRGVHPD